MGCSGSKAQPKGGDAPGAHVSADGSKAPAAAATSSAIVAAVGQAANNFFGNENPALGDLRIAMARNDVQRLHQEQTRVGGPTADAQREAAELKRREEEESPAGALKKAWDERRKGKQQSQPQQQQSRSVEEGPESQGESPDPVKQPPPRSVSIEISGEPSSPIPRQATASPLSSDYAVAVDASRGGDDPPPTHDRRGTVTETEKQLVRNKATGILLGSNSTGLGGEVDKRRSVGSPFLHSSTGAVSAAPTAEGNSRSVATPYEAEPSGGSDFPQHRQRSASPTVVSNSALSLDQANALTEELIRSKRDRDAAAAASHRVQSELDQARTELVYLRAAAEATDNFHDLQRIPPQWVPSQLQTIAELRRRVAQLEDECVILKHSLREQQQQQQHRGADSSSPSSWFTDDALVPSSPTALVARVRELQSQLSQGHAEIERLAAARDQGAAQLREIESAVSQAQETESEYRTTIRTLLDKERELQIQLQALQSNMGATAAAAAASAASAASASSKTSGSAGDFLKQLSAFLVTAEHCPEETRMELLQYCCEHSGLAVPGKPSLVTDPEVFDMNGVLYGDCLAFLSSLIIQRRESRIASLILSETCMSDMGAAQLSLTLAVLSFETPLSLINVSNNEITCRGALQLLTALGTAGCNKVVRKSLTLDLDNNPIYHTVQDVKLLTEQLAHMRQHFPQITVQLPRVPKNLESQLLRSASVAPK